VPNVSIKVSVHDIACSASREAERLSNLTTPVTSLGRLTACDFRTEPGEGVHLLNNSEFFASTSRYAAGHTPSAHLLGELQLCGGCEPTARVINNQGSEVL
jgi:hypothetical protein